MSSPFFVVPTVYDGQLPTVEHFSIPMNQVATDLSRILDEAIQLQEDIVKSFNNSIAAINAVESRTDASRTAIVLASTSLGENDIETVIETFNDPTQCEQGTNALIDGGVATLGVEASYNMMNGATVRILPNLSTGHPGNLCEIKELKHPIVDYGMVAQRCALYGDPDSMADITAIGDDNITNAFEYEYNQLGSRQIGDYHLFLKKKSTFYYTAVSEDMAALSSLGVTNVVDKQSAWTWKSESTGKGESPLDVIKPDGWSLVDKYEEGQYSFKIGDTYSLPTLKLVLQIELPAPSQLSWLQLVPALPVDAPEYTYTIERVAVSYDGISWQTVNSAPIVVNNNINEYAPSSLTRSTSLSSLGNIKGTATVKINALASYVRIFMSTSNSYRPKYGFAHLAYFEVDKVKTTQQIVIFSSSSTSTKVKRLAGEAEARKIVPGHTTVKYKNTLLSTLGTIAMVYYGAKSVIKSDYAGDTSAFLDDLKTQFVESIWQTGQSTFERSTGGILSQLLDWGVIDTTNLKSLAEQARDLTKKKTSTEPEAPPIDQRLLVFADETPFSVSGTFTHEDFPMGGG